MNICPKYICFHIFFIIRDGVPKRVRQPEQKDRLLLWVTVSRSRGVTDTASCMESDKSRCSWLRNQQTCTRLCRCINSNNQGLQEKGAVSKRKGCTCRSLNKVKARRVSCKDQVERKSRCPCLCVGVKCDNVCRSTNCGNGKDCPDKCCSSTTPTKRKRTNPQT